VRDIAKGMNIEDYMMQAMPQTPESGSEIKSKTL
jgi:hypothetical protein